MPDILPNESFPSDATIMLLDATLDAATGLPYIAKGTGPASVPSYEVQYNRRLQRQNRRLAIACEGLVVNEGGLKIGVYPCNYTLGGMRKRFDGATNQAVSDNATSVVYVDSSNILQIASSYPADVSSHLPLATVVATAGALTIRPETSFARLEVDSAHGRIDATVGAESSNTINVAFTLKTAGGVALARRWLAEFWVADAAFGDLASSAPSGGITVATGQQIGGAIVAGKHLRIMSNASGVLAVDVTHSSAATFHAVVCGGGFELTASAAMTFT